MRRLSRFSSAALCAWAGLCAAASPLTAAPRDAGSDFRVTDTRPLQGEVRDSLSGETLPGIEVRLGERMTLTDTQGRFSIERGQPPYRLALSRPGADPVIRTVSEVESLSFVVLILDPEVTREERVEVFGAAEDDPSPASIPLRPQQVLQVAGAVDNVFRALQTLPGIAATEEFGSRLSVRGGTPDQNLTIMDGVEIHNPYRLFGLTSAFNPETVEKFELSAGAFSARYGDRLSSILVIENREGGKEKGVNGSSTLSITDGNILLEGPWRNPDRGSWIVSARRTYYDLIAERIIDQDLPGFHDLQFRGSFDPSASSRVTLFGIRSREGGDARFEGDGTDYGAFVTAAENDVVGLRARRFFGTRLSATLAAAYYNFAQTLAVDALFEDGTRRSNSRNGNAKPQINVNFNQTTATRDASVRNDWSLALSSGHLLEAGFEAHGLRTGASYDIAGERNLSEANASSVRGGASLPDFYDETFSSNRWGAYVQDRMTMGRRASGETGLRLSRSSLTGHLEVEPRVSLLVRQGENARWRAAFGVHSQSPGIEKLLQSDYFLDLSGLGLKDERARHATLGFEKDLKGLSLKAEAYFKTFRDLIGGALETDAELETRLSRYDFPPGLQDSVPNGRLITTRPQNGASGRAYGIEVVATRPRREAGQRLSGWVSYSLGKATKNAYGLTLPFEYDRRHALSIVGQFQASEKFDIGFTLRASSGFPRTRAVGVRVAPVRDALDADGDGDTEEWIPQRDPSGLLVYTADYGDVANLLRERYPLFARVDLRVNWRPHGPRSRWLFYLEFINATNRQNVGQYEATLRAAENADRPVIEETPAAALPFLPTFGVRFRF